MKKKLLIFSVISNVLLLIFSLFCYINLGGRSYFIQKYYDSKNNNTQNIVQARKNWYNDMPIVKNRTIMLGDSLTENIEWNELIGNDNIINRGIGGDTSEAILNRIDDVIKRYPEKVFIMVGINDLASKKPLSTLIDNYKNIISEIKEKSPNTKIYTQSILPINTNIKFLYTDNNRIVEANSKIKEISNQDNVTYIDLHDKFLKDNQLNSEYTYDGLHLNTNGYKIWKEYLNDYIN